MCLGENIRFLRTKKGYSQDDIANKLGYKSFTTIQKWESGVSEPPLKALKKLSEIFNVDMNDLATKKLSTDTNNDNNVYYLDDARDMTQFVCENSEYKVLFDASRKVKKENTSSRLKYLMNTRGLRQIDILNKCIPFCKKYNIKMNKSDISQYVSGKVEPNQNKLFILGQALDVAEAWLMGLDVPMERAPKYDPDTEIVIEVDLAKQKQVEVAKHLLAYCNKLNDKGIKEAAKRVEELTYIPEYTVDDNSLLNAAHELEEASKTEQKHDNDIMNNDDEWK